MLGKSAISIATNSWAAHFGCPADELFAGPLRIVTHGHKLADYRGVFGLFHDTGAIVSLPANNADVLCPLLSGLVHDCSPGALATALRPVAGAIIGPAYIGYATEIARPTHSARALNFDDASALDALRQSCAPTEWEHGGSPLDHPCSGVVLEGELVAIAGYETWGATIAHISVVTHPEFRGRGFGRSAVAHVATRAISVGLLPQFRALESNYASIHIAESLGFCAYARSLAVRFNNG
jgi:GNAT superfamily N-acetyltransferase